MKIKDASSLLRDNIMTVTPFMSIIVSLLKLSNIQNQHTTKSHYKSVLSPAIQKFAEKSRIYSGESLLKRSIRHTIDRAVLTVVDGLISVGYYKDDMVIIFENKVKPSIIKGLCTTKMRFNGQHIVGISCDCKYGCKVDTSLINHHEKNMHSCLITCSFSMCIFV